MSDPNAEAAQRAWAEYREGPFVQEMAEGYITAAREMAKSVQKLHKPIVLCGVVCCQRCRTNTGAAAGWPCETAKRVYPSEELGL